MHTGDFLHYDSGLPNVLALLDRLPQPRLGSYAVLGNHDYATYSHQRDDRTRLGQVQPTARGPQRVAAHAAAVGPNPPSNLRTTSPIRRWTSSGPAATTSPRWRQALATRGIPCCKTAHLRLTAPDLDLYLVGVDDFTEGTPALGVALADIPPNAPTILLSHNPDILIDPCIHQVDLVLSGHTHGGQIVLPLLGAAHTQTEHLRRSEVSGYLRRGNTQVYITRGIGEGIPIRFGAAPQVTLITVLGI